MTSGPLPVAHRLLERTRQHTRTDPVAVLVGGCGSGRTECLTHLQKELGAEACQYVDFERVSTTPERCLRSIVSHSPFGMKGESPARSAGARDAFDALLTFLMRANGKDGLPATFLFDEVLEVRTFESFPGLRSAQMELARAIAQSPNTFVVSTRFATRARRWIQVAPDRFEVLPLAPLAPSDVREALSGAQTTLDLDDLAETVQALVDGRPAYVRALLNKMAGMRAGASDPIAALAGSLAPDGEIAARCRFSYELRLHRARGYGALKAILDVLAQEEPLTLTGIAQRLGRTPGSTKDYLSWLQDVDLVSSERKRYRFADPVLRLWVRIHDQPTAPDDERTAYEVQSYAMDRLKGVGAPVAATRADVSSGRGSGIIEID
jgi:hypothetical protein